MFDTRKVHDSWKEFFGEDDVKNELNRISAALDGAVFYPSCDLVFRFAENNLDTVRSVIVGMDPYPSWDETHSRPQATGRAFEVSELSDKNWDYRIRQASLRNILKALYYNESKNLVSLEQVRKQINTGNFIIPPPVEWFDLMERRGVMFLNSTLTVLPNSPGSHKQLWTDFRVMLADMLSGRNITWHLWGQNAVSEYGEMLRKDEHILSAPHPRMAGFVVNNTFQYDSEILWTK